MGNTSAFVPSFDKPQPAGASTSTESSSFSEHLRKPPKRVTEVESLLTAEDVAKRLNVSTDWVWDHSSRKKPLLPVIRMGDGALRYRPSGIEAFIDERERLSALRRRVS
jgi:predicted DNA-binding transcriptional regulator AlpA